MVRPGKRQVTIVASGGITPGAGAGAVVIPVENGNQVKADINGRPVHLEIDLGSSGAVRLTNRAFERVSAAGVVSSSGSQTSEDGITRKTRMIKADLRIGSITAKGAAIGSGYEQPGADGLLDNGFFSQEDTIVDLQRGQLILTSTRPAG